MPVASSVAPPHAAKKYPKVGFSVPVFAKCDVSATVYTDSRFWCSQWRELRRRVAVVDEDRLATLRRWGEGLGQDGREDLRAAGKAILMLIDEIERLHVELWHARMTHGIVAEPEAEGPETAVAEPPLDMTLARRIRLLLRHNVP
jgi:hypothetical protein